MSALLSPLSLQAADVRRSGDEAFIIQQQRQEALEQQLTPSAPDVRLSAPGSFAHKINFLLKRPVFRLNRRN
ncbi:conserved hypothetical protein [Escherichia coli 3431]|nr:conserved hypothetical protein [Escherichia coli 3431]